MNIPVMPWQREVIQHPARFQFVGGARRLGKSFLAEARIRWKCLTRPNWNTMLVTPLAIQGEPIFDSLQYDEQLRPYILRSKSRPGRMWFKNGSKFECRSFERPAGIRSSNVNECIFDEIQSVASGEDFHNVLRPVLSDRSGSVLLLGQFRGNNWFYRDFYLPGQAAPGSELNPLDGGVPRYKSWRFPTYLAPWAQNEKGKRELEIVKSQVPEYTWRTEYLCEVCTNPNAVFTTDQLARITKGDLPDRPARGEGDDAYICGLDLGRVVDPSAVVIIHRHTGRVVYVERFPLGMSHDEQSDRLARLASRWRALVVLDSTGGATGGYSKVDEFLKLYRSKYPRVKSVWLGAHNKEAIISALTLAVQKVEITIPAACATLLDELASYEWERRGDYYSFQGPRGHADDTVIALALANWGRKNKWDTVTDGLPLSYGIG